MNWEEYFSPEQVEERRKRRVERKNIRIERRNARKLKRLQALARCHNLKPRTKKPRKYRRILRKFIPKLYERNIPKN